METSTFAIDGARNICSSLKGERLPTQAKPSKETLNIKSFNHH